MLTNEILATINEDRDLNDKNIALQQLGGLDGLIEKMETNPKMGLQCNDKELQKRRECYGSNEFETPPPETWLALFLESFQDSTVIVLIVSAVVSLAVGLYESLSTGWIEGSAILVAVLIVAVVTATNNYMKELQFRKLNEVKDDVNVSVLRNGVTNHVSVKELVVGDIVQLNAGDKIPADGVMILGSDVICDESALTGESEGRQKEHWEAGDPFLLSGSTLSSGYCEMVVTAVGIQSRWGKIKADLNTETAETPLQEKLTVLADQIGYGGMAAAGATFIAIIAIYFLFPESRDPSKSLFDIVLKSFIMAVTIVVVAVPEGLPLAVTLSLAFSTQKMMEDNNLIRVLEACETMGNATNICSDKTGTLTENRMTVVAGWINGVEYDHCPTADEIPSEIANILSESISVNTTAHLSVSEKKQQLKPFSADREIEVLGNKTEGALLIMLKKNWNKDYLMLRSHGLQLPRGDKLITFSSQRKCMTMIQNFPTVHKVFIKGAGEVILHKCKKFLTNNGMEQVISKKLMSELNEVILKMSKKALRVIALAHKEVASGGSPPSVEDVDHYESDLTLDGIFGIIDPLRPDVIEAVRTCQSAGVFVRMVTGDNIETAKAIAASCGILTAGGVAMEGPEFRRLTPKQLDDLLPKLQVLARSSPNDKYTLVCRLNGHNLPETREDWEAMHPALSYESQKDLVLPGYLEEWEESRQGGGEVVGVTGDGTNDGPALKAADVGLSMGLSGTDVAKDASDIVILDDNFASIVKAVLWGRSVFDNIRKFLQFQLTVNLVALTVTFLSAVTGYAPPLNAVMMLWVNLIMDTMGALALGTESPSESLLNRLPYKRNASLISRVMWKNIFCQSIFQILLLGYLLKYGPHLFNTALATPFTDAAAAAVVTHGSIEHYTIIFNVFVFCQIFNEYNARSITNDPNIFRGLQRNPIFLMISVVTVIGQYFLVQHGGDFVKTTPLDPDTWYKCILLASLTLPVGGLMRCIPISECRDDMITPNPLMTHHTREIEGGAAGGSNGKKYVARSSGISLIFWLTIVTIIPAAIVNTFQLPMDLLPVVREA